MNYICECGNKSEITWDNFKQGKRCMKCSGSEKYTYKFVYTFFKKHNCELLEIEYINTDTKMLYKCECKNESEISFYNFKKGMRCMKCSGNEKLTFEFIKEQFKKENCELLESQYIDSKTIMKYLCQCKSESSITWNSFNQGHRCIDCGFDKQQKNSKQFKEYIFGSGEVRKIQGYENIALDELVKKFDEKDIITNKRDMPNIKYNFENKERRYYPDIWIKSINKIIEVKSYYTYKKELIKNIMKALATRKLGYDFEFWIYNRDKKDFKKIIV
jgi:hypothetical protein